MSNITAIGSGVFVDQDLFPSVGRAEIEFLDRALADSPRGRTRLCMHKLLDDRMHEMFISFVGGNYVRPAKHVGKDESLHLIEGWGDYFFFDENGEVTDVVPLGDYGSDRQFYCRIPAMRNHAIFIRSNRLVFHEATPGPFVRDNTIFSPWSPAEDDAPAIERWLSRTRPQTVTRPPLTMKRLTDHSFIADTPVVSVGRDEIEFLKAEMHRSNIGGISLTLNSDPESSLRETIQLRRQHRYVRPQRLAHDQSIHVLEGTGDVVFFDDRGSIAKSVPVGSNGSGRDFYVRLPARTFHFVLVHSDILVTHDVEGCAVGQQEGEYAAWSPIESDTDFVGEFLRNLAAAVAG